MARLTRTQKYAELRDKIAQDREESFKTNELSEYENKLKKLNGFDNELYSAINNNEDVLLNDRPVIKEEDKQAQEDHIKSLDEILDSMMGTSFPSTSNDEDISTSVIEEKTMTSESTNNNQEEEKKNILSTMQIISEEVQELSDIIGDEPVENNTPILYRSEEKSEPVINENTIETKKENNIETINDDFVRNTLNEADVINTGAGRTILSQLTDNIVDEVRHPEESGRIAEERFADSDFSNTVSLEIEKVLAEIKGQSQEQAVVIEDKPVENNDDIFTDEMFNNPTTISETFEHPVLAKTVEEPVVDIKNINETFSNPVVDSNVLDDTIPFVVDRNEIDQDDEDDEEEAPSKVLNVILGILIFVLVAVLGVIVYYILVAKGIIG